MESIAPPTHDDILEVDGGAVVTAIFLASLLALSFSSSSQDHRPTRLTPLIHQRQKSNFVLLVLSVVSATTIVSIDNYR